MRPHCDQDTIALLALGEQVAPADHDHVAACADCAEQVQSLARVVASARPPLALTPGPDVAPPPGVWAAVAAATGTTASPRLTLPVGAAAPVPLARRRRERARRRLSRPMLLVAACAALLGAAGGSLATLGLADRGQRTVVVATTRLVPLTSAVAASGQAQVVRSGGSRTLDLDVSRLAATGGFYEVWLIDSQVKRMVAIGVLHGSNGRFTIPDGLDLRQYPIVDVSDQPLNGDPAHSGDSVLRGRIQA